MNLHYVVDYAVVPFATGINIWQWGNSAESFPCGSSGQCCVIGV